jgi:hypothetical protein
MAFFFSINGSTVFAKVAFQQAIVVKKSPAGLVQGDNILRRVES